MLLWLFLLFLSLMRAVVTLAPDLAPEEKRMVERVGSGWFRR